MNNSQSLMVQGTTSDAGKTTLVAGLCRLYARAGVNVAPFKPQNMALNSAVTPEGDEIGRSQALQAYAAGIDAHSDMNPILLKPHSDTGAQVIIQGQARLNLEAGAYHDYKPQAMIAALDSYQRLQQQFPVLLIEGAGSPAEINLREGDIANMGFAEAADCPVILVADIDRGGVFAHLVGTLQLLSPSEQQRVKGFVINRFRGDIALLESGLTWLEEKTGKPVLAVLPYLHNLRLDAEDAIDQHQSGASDNEQCLTIKVPVFPRISNHTDFDSLRLHPQVNVIYVGEGDTLEGADLIILPGSKSVRADLAWFKQQGFDHQLDRHLRYGGKLLGICGGFQMLGNTISDPDGIESPVKKMQSADGVAQSLEEGNLHSSNGLGYLDMETELRPTKQLHQRRGHLHFNPPSCPVSGYEIHCGISSGPALDNPLVTLIAEGSSNTVFDGAMSDDHRVAGTYLHGLLDQPQSLKALLEWAGLCDRYGVTEIQTLDRNAIRDTDLDRLADSLAEHIRWPSFTKVTGLPCPLSTASSKQ